MIKVEAPIYPNHKKGYYVTVYYMHGDADAYTEDEIYFEDSCFGAIAAERFYRMINSYELTRPNSEEGEAAFWNSIEPPAEYYLGIMPVKDIILNIEFYFAGDCTCDDMYSARVNGVHMTYWDGANWCNCTVGGEDWWKPEKNEENKNE